MQIDYKFLTNRTKTSIVRSRPGKHHLLILAGIIAGLSIALSFIPDSAVATRTKPMPPADEILASVPDVTESVTQKLALPPEPSAAAPAMAAPEAAPEPKGTWHSVTVKSGDNLTKIFARLGLSVGQLHEILQLGEKVDHLKNLYPGENVRLRISDDHQVDELVHKLDESHSLRVVRDGDGYRADELHRELEVRTAHAVGTIEDSLFVAGQNAGLSDSMIMELAAIFGWDIDFALDIRRGDHFTVVYQEYYLEGKKVRDGDILAAEFTNQGKSYRAIRYVDADGNAGFYTPEGLSLRKAFLRTPVKFSRISSRFTLHRKHPILNRIRAHKGVDYAAPRGTPIRATGDGKVVFRGRKGGYGRTIVIQHGSKYSTLYGHMSRYNGKVKLGRRVRQGQVIGYVGSSGLATGPHLHYEFRIDGVHRNPLTVKLPVAEPIAKRYRDDFQKLATPLIAQLELLTRSLVARN